MVEDDRSSGLTVRMVEDDRSSGFSEVSAAEAQHGEAILIDVSRRAHNQWILDIRVY